MQLGEDIIRRGPLLYTMKMLNGKWKSTVIWLINLAENQTIRYGKLKRSIDFDISHKALSIQLRELEVDGIIIRREYDEKPLRVEYSLTEKGKSLANIIYMMRDWGAVWGDYEDTPVVRLKGEDRGDGLTYYHQGMDLARAHLNEQVPSSPTELPETRELVAWRVPDSEFVQEQKRLSEGTASAKPEDEF